jgi:hypothetical protein
VATDLQLVEALEAGAHDDVPLLPGLMGAPPPLVEDGLQTPLGGIAHGRQPLVGVVDIGLLAREVGMGHRSVSGEVCRRRERQS